MFPRHSSSLLLYPHMCTHMSAHVRTHTHKYTHIPEIWEVKKDLEATQKTQCLTRMNLSMGYHIVFPLIFMGYEFKENFCSVSLKKKSIWLLWVLVVACRIFVAEYRLLVAACGFLVPWSRIKTRHPALGGWSLNHWTTREVCSIF